MNAPFQTPGRMSVDEFVGWADHQVGRHELFGGEVAAMAPEEMGHSRAKRRLVRALEQAIAASGLQCEAISDGMAVVIGERTFLIPDVMMRCGEKLPDKATRVTDPLLVIEVLSPSNKAEEMIFKFEQYLSLPTLKHYIEVNPTTGLILHYRRADEGVLLNFGRMDQCLRLDPPGITLMLD